jgi:hypothetical protein
VRCKRSSTVCLAQKAAINGKSEVFFAEMEQQIDLFKSGTDNADIVFAIGQSLNGEVDEKQGNFWSELWI